MTSPDIDLLTAIASKEGYVLTVKDSEIFGRVVLRHKDGEICAGPTHWNPLYRLNDAGQLVIDHQVSVVRKLGGWEASLPHGSDGAVSAFVPDTNFPDNPRCTEYAYLRAVCEVVAKP